MKRHKIRVGKKGKKIDSVLHDTLMRHYDLDDEKGLCTIHFRFDKFDDFFETHVGKRPLLKGTLRDDLEETLLRIPKCYDLILDIDIKDDQKHTKEEAVTALRDGLEFNSYSYRNRLHGKSVISLVLLFVGLAVLILLALLKVFVFKDNDTAAEGILSEVLDIAASVFIWEAVTLYFIERNETKAAWGRARSRIRSICFHYAKDRKGEGETCFVGRLDKPE